MTIGLLLSLSTSYTIISVFNLDVPISGDELFKQFMIAVILGPVIGIGSLIFYVERLKLLWQLFIHFLYVSIVVIIAGWFGNWYEKGNIFSLFEMFIVVIIVYILIWLILSIIAKRDIEKINQKLKSRKEKML